MLARSARQRAQLEFPARISPSCSKLLRIPKGLARLPSCLRTYKILLMAKESKPLETEAQAVLDELWREKLIPFALNVGKITEHSGHHTIHFHDSRIYTADIPLGADQSWGDRVRAAVLARVAELRDTLE